MKIALLCGHSPANVELARLTAQNHWDYANAQGYDLVSISGPMEPYAKWIVRDLKALANTLLGHHAVLMIDPDVLFTNLTLGVGSLLGEHDAVAMSREPEGRSPINAGVSLWKNCASAHTLLWRLIDDEPIWSARPVGPGWQEHICSTPELLAQVSVLQERTLCATDKGGSWYWQKGDLLCHFLGGTVESKIDRIKGFTK